MKNKKAKQHLLIICLLIVYLIILTWIILFKMQFSFKNLYRFQGFDLITFHGSVLVNGRISISEILYNILMFIPFGVYISMLKINWSFFKKIVPIIITSLLFEILQFIFSIGSSDITDVIGNTLGELLEL